ncbi:8195_t:CDS:1 [Funneliformis geosporum]|uniref:17977_t:CDS:1 n=1 Tax=Funneliformis geosporum TaxID=1117311 RepID=A0A9W4SRV3_9GLOM|nr:17977_t:CDS:1 [Funneliformis geosporum]CAI2197097.1 8195_t:CDS:1 [Funneliformis geosporum]
MAFIHSNFDYLDKVWWKLDYDDRNAQYFISNTKRLQQVISLYVYNEEEHFLKGYIDLHRERYLIACISTESNIDFNVVQQMVKKSWFKVFLSYIYRIIFSNILLGPFTRLASIIFKPSQSSHLAKKVQNLHDAINDIFPSTFYPNLPMRRFTPLLARNLHKQVGKGIIDNAGQYRTIDVMSEQDNFVYLAPNLIKDKIEVLFRQCRKNFEREDLELEEAVKFGACFLAHFLYIHPFKKGNGRVARLLLSYLLSRFTVMPLSLYLGSKTRKVYLKCLREATWYHEPPFKPDALANFILENIFATAYHICVVMDLNIQNKD